MRLSTIISALALLSGTTLASDDVLATSDVPHLPIKPHQPSYGLWTGAGFRGNLTIDRDAFAAYFLRATNITLSKNHLLPNFHVFVDDDLVPGEETAEINIDPATGVFGTLKVSLPAYSRALAVRTGNGKVTVTRDECACECLCFSLCSTAASIFGTGALGTAA